MSWCNMLKNNIIPPGKVNYDLIPNDLKNLKQWLMWKIEHTTNSKGEVKPTKVPYQAKFPARHARSDADYTWCDCKTARFVLENEKGFSGIGFAFQDYNKLVVIDIDHCIDPETRKIDNDAALCIMSMNTYTELSQSGTGIHIIGYGSNPHPENINKGGKKGKYELYSHNHYFSLTGNVVNGYTKIHKLDPLQLNGFYNRFIVKPEKIEEKQVILPKKSVKTSYIDVDLSDEKIIELCSNAANSSKFVALWRGSDCGYSSHSECDIALCSILAFYTQDANQLQRMMRNSGLYREKMDRIDYITSTINKVLGSQREKYNKSAIKRKIASDLFKKITGKEIAL
jgi:putative DNA primase/helicase